MNDMLLPDITVQELLLVRIAREIAVNNHPLERILELYSIDDNAWDRLKNNPRFVNILNAEMIEWNSAKNVEQRVRLKSGAMIEEWLPEVWARMHDPKEDLLKKVKGAELVVKLSGMGQPAASQNGSPSDNLIITINLGADNQLKYSGRVPPKVIENTPTNSELEDDFEASIDSVDQELKEAIVSSEKKNASN